MLIFKNSFRKIKKSLGRFLSLIFIVMLGSAFFSGIRESSMDMIKTIDEYYDETKLMDFKIISTLGLTKGDVESIKEIPNLIVEPGYSFDILLDGDVTRIHSLTEINKVNLINGNMPKENECLVEDGTYEIGDKIIINSDNLNNKEYTVSGTITSSLYIYKSKGISNIGDGKLDKYIFIPKSNFNLDYYTEIYLIEKNSVNEISYLKDYKNIIDNLENKLKELKPIRETIRYEEILKEATDKINEAQDKLNTEKLENETKLNDAKRKIDNGYNELNKALNNYYNGLNTLEQTKKNTINKFNNAKKEIENGKNQYNQILINQNLDENKIKNKLELLEENIKQSNLLLNTLDKDSKEYIELNNKILFMNEQKNNLLKLMETKNKLDQSENELNKNINLFNNEYNKNKNILINAKNEIDKNKKTLDSNKVEYDKNYNKFIEEINKGQLEINNAKEDLNKIEKPKWYLLSREDNSGYTNFYESAIKVDSIAKVFPIFFMLVVFLMSLNTMTRMIEEERGEIGVFVSLGISKVKIVFSYLFYVLIATTLGLLIGLAIGYSFVPHVLYSIYHANFIIPELKTYVEFIPCLSIILVTIILMVAVTLITLFKDFKYVPATLLRPEPPKNGKKVLLERIKFIWNKLSFTWKVTIRNLFRYKKRIIMTLLGISGCTALLLTGFGIKDSVKSLVDIQYNDIHVYDTMLFLKDEVKNINNDFNDIIENNLYTHFENFTFEVPNKRIDTYLMAFENKDLVDNYIKITDLNNNKLELNDDGVIITQKMAELLNVNINDTIEIRNSDNKLYFLKVKGIAKNYVNSYIYMTKDYYNEIFEEIKYNTIITNISKDKATTLMNTGKFNNIQFTEDTLDVFTDIIKGMNNIVILIILSSSLLAIIVLYNLTTININERKREIATLKVLGFRDKEVSDYIYRETLILTIFGIFIGMFLGVVLNNFVLTIAETDEILFVKNITLNSYIITFFIMIFFTILVQIITHFVLKKIDMIESLKSVE